MVPGINETLRVNGRAEISQDAELLTPLAVQNVVPIIGLRIHVEETYFHCGKALMVPSCGVRRHRSSATASRHSAASSPSRLPPSSPKSLRRRWKKAIVRGSTE